MTPMYQKFKINQRGLKRAEEIGLNMSQKGLKLTGRVLHNQKKVTDLLKKRSQKYYKGF